MSVNEDGRTEKENTAPVLLQLLSQQRDTRWTTCSHTKLNFLFHTDSSPLFSHLLLLFSLWYSPYTSISRLHFNFTPLSTNPMHRPVRRHRRFQHECHWKTIQSSRSFEKQHDASQTRHHRRNRPNYLHLKVASSLLPASLE